MTTTRVRAGFIPLLDAALLVVAAHGGFAEEEGLDLELTRETAWAAVRDKLAVGQLDAAHLLGPAAVATSLGLGALAMPLVVPASLNLNGNAISVSRALHDALSGVLDGDAADPASTAQALRRVIAQRGEAGLPPLVFAHVFPFSTHHYQLRLWLRAGGISPDGDVRMTVVPPPAMAASLARGAIDGFCVGAPWSELAARSGHGVTLHRGTDLGPATPEKVLAVRAAWDEDKPQTTERLVRALLRAAGWCADPDNRDRLADLMAAPGILDTDPAMLAALLAGAPDDGRPADPAFLRLDPAVVEPRPSDADWIVDRMVEAGQADGGEALRRRARALYRPDRFARAMRRD